MSIFIFEKKNNRNIMSCGYLAEAHTPRGTWPSKPINHHKHWHLSTLCCNYFWIKLLFCGELNLFYWRFIIILYWSLWTLWPDEFILLIITFFFTLLMDLPTFFFGVWNDHNTCTCTIHVFKSNINCILDLFQSL